MTYNLNSKVDHRKFTWHHFGLWEHLPPFLHVCFCLLFHLKMKSCRHHAVSPSFTEVREAPYGSVESSCGELLKSAWAPTLPSHLQRNVVESPGAALWAFWMVPPAFSSEASRSADTNRFPSEAAGSENLPSSRWMPTLIGRFPKATSLLPSSLLSCT